MTEEKQVARLNATVRHLVEKNGRLVDELKHKDGVLKQQAHALMLQQQEIERLTKERDEALAKVKAVQDDHPYVIGFNAGWDEAISQNFRFPTMLRKMWSGGEVQNWINEQFAAALKGGDTSAVSD